MIIEVIIERLQKYRRNVKMRVGASLIDSDITFEQRKHELERLNKQDKERWEREERERAQASKSPYKDWAQLNRKNVVHLIKAAQENPTALSVLLFLIENMNKMNAIVASYAVIQEVLGMSKPTVTRSIKYLKEKGFIAIYKSGSSNVYVVNNDLVWTNYGNKVMYSKFPANVILSASEQSEIDQHTKLKFDYSKVMIGNEKLSVPNSITDLSDELNEALQDEEQACEQEILLDE